LEGPVASQIHGILGTQWFDQKGLIDYALATNDNWYLPERGMHPPSRVHLNWFHDCVAPRLVDCKLHQLDSHFTEKIKTMSEAW